MSRKWSLTSKLALSYATLIVFILLLTMGYLFRMQTQNINELVDYSISSLSTTLATDPNIITALEENSLSTSTAQYLNQINETQEYVDFIVVVNSEDIRLYHPDAEKIGLTFQGGDEGDALSGAAPYITEGKGTREFQRRAFSSVYNDQDEVVGFVMVSAYTRTISYIKQQELLKYLIIIAVAMVLGILLAFFIARNIRKTLLGYDPTQISQKFLQQEEILSTLTEGLLLLSKDGTCEYVNPAAMKLFGITSKQPEIDSKIQSFIARYILPEKDSTESVYQYQLQFEDTILLMDRIPIIEQKKVIGILVLLNDKTETTKLAEELTGVNHIIAALRATTHEHKNVLHVILGLLQTGNASEAMSYINSSASISEDNSYILNRIQNRTIAALILGKKSQAKELNITFNLSKNSNLDAHNDYLSAIDLVTIIGNLIENAFDALSHWDGTREVSLYINNSDNGLTIIVDDTGPGMSPDIIERLLHESYTTKGEGHGVGLTLIRNIVDRCDGVLDIESEPGEGSSFSVAISKKRTR